MQTGQERALLADDPGQMRRTELLDLAADAYPSTKEKAHTWVLITESPEGGWAFRAMPTRTPTLPLWHVPHSQHHDEVRGWAGPSQRNITVHTLVAHSVASDTRRLEQVRDLAELGRLIRRVAEVLQLNERLKPTADSTAAACEADSSWTSPSEPRKHPMSMISNTTDARVRVLADGTQIPLLGLGVWQVPNGPTTIKAVRWAPDLGYRHIDTAQI